MRQLITIMTLSLLILSCDNKTKSESNDESDIFTQSFSDYKELSTLKNYSKVSDTSYVKNGVETTHRITHLKRNNENLILFNKISRNENAQEVYSLLDTLKIYNLDSNSFISIGYCEMNNLLPEEVIAIVEKTEKDTIQKIQRAWKANSGTKKIEKIKDLDKLTCLNEF